MNIYEQIDMMFSGEVDERPQWANEILVELKELKSMLQTQVNKHVDQTSSYSNHINTYQKQGLYKFIVMFRKSMKADTINNKYPTFHYQGRELGIDFKGLLYDKRNSKTLPRDEAYRVYRYAFENQNITKISA